MRILLDTNAYPALLRGRDEIAERVRVAEQILFSTIVVGELLYGFRNGSRAHENTARLDAFLANPRVRLCTAGRVTADRFGRIAAELRRAGTPIPTNDIWIGAQAMETGAELLSYDQHFRAIPGLAWVLLRSDPPV